ncbi:MAG: hypothetical protein UDK33_05330 [Prevotella sp.]|nr:hypothetical protein [Prevotella sp.]
MKKFLFILLFALISVNVFSQKVLRVKSCYDSNNNLYIKTQIVNDTWKDIVCIVFTIEYGYTSLYDTNRFKEVVVRTSILSGTTKVISYYPPEHYLKPLRQSLSRVIFSDGTYKDY